MSEQNHYDTLGVLKTANDSEIKKAYRALSLKYHPDRNQTDEAASKIREVNLAYETLSDPIKRKHFDLDQRMDNLPFGFSGMGAGMPFTHMASMDEMGGGDLNNIFSMLFGGGGGGGMHSMASMGPGMHSMAGIPEIRVFHGGIPHNSRMQGHSQMFHQMRQSPPSVQKPAPIINTLAITLEQAFQGYTLPIEIERWLMIGDMKIHEEETIYITIPAGIDDNEIIVLQEKGNVADEQHKGDIKITVQLQNTSVFKRNGLDLIYKKVISLKEALCGFSFEISHLNGKTMSLNNKTHKSIVKPNYRKVVPNLGMVRDGTYGSLIIEFDVEFPDSLTAEQITVIEQLL